MTNVVRTSNGELHLGGIGSKSSIGIFDDCLAIGEWNIEEFPLRGRYCQVGFQFAEIDQSEILPFEDGIHKLRGSSITLFEFIELILKKGKVTPKELPGMTNIGPQVYAYLVLALLMMFVMQWLSWWAKMLCRTFSISPEKTLALLALLLPPTNDSAWPRMTPDSLLLEPTSKS